MTTEKLEKEIRRMSVKAYPIVPSNLDIPEGLLPDGVEYHDGLPFATREEADAWAESVTAQYENVTYVEIVEVEAQHVLHYTSADGPGDDSSWSVYRERYATPDSDQPIDGSQELVSTHPDEASADAEARRLQNEAT